MPIVERNDVDITPIFNWGKEFTLIGSNDEIVARVHMRLVGDADMNRARIYALRKSAEKRKKLRTEDSDEKLAFIVDKEELERDKLIALCVLFASRNLAKDAIKSVSIPLPKEPKSDAATEAFEKYQAAIDEYPFKREAAIKDYIEHEIKSLTESFSKVDTDDLYKSYVGYVTDELCEEEMLNAFKEMCTYLGTFKDDKYKERFFDSFEDFANMDGYLKRQFMVTYASLDMSADDLKKLQQATR